MITLPALRKDSPEFTLSAAPFVLVELRRLNITKGMRSLCQHELKITVAVILVEIRTTEMTQALQMSTLIPEELFVREGVPT